MATYTVKSGDTLSGIASRNGMSLGQIRALNSGISDALRIGQVINVGGGGAVMGQGGVIPIGTINASTLGATFSAGATNNNYGGASTGARITGGGVRPIAGSGGTYTVKSGDSLGGIAAKYGLTLAQLRSYNPQITNPNVISVGQVISLGGASITGGGVVPVVSVKPNGTPTVTPIKVDPATSTVPVTTASSSSKAGQKISDFAHGIGVSVSVLGVLGLLAFVVLSKRNSE
jgi:LysM repeat protein